MASSITQRLDALEADNRELRQIVADLDARLTDVLELDDVASAPDEDPAEDSTPDLETVPAPKGKGK